MSSFAEKNVNLKARLDKDQEEKPKEVQTAKRSPSLINEMTIEKGRKSARMSLRVHPETRDLFTKINTIRGLTNNSAMNMIMSEYVEKYLYLLKEE